MIPFRQSYDVETIYRFKEDFKFLADYVKKFGNSKWQSQRDISIEGSLKSYGAEIHNYREEIMHNFSKRCVYCASKQNVDIYPIHPLEKNLEYPELCQDIHNIYVLCKRCRSKLNISYKKVKLIQSKKITTLDLLKKIPNFILPTFEPIHKYIDSRFLDASFGNHRSFARVDIFYRKFFDNLPFRFMFTIDILKIDYLQEALELLIEGREEISNNLDLNEAFYESCWFTLNEAIKNTNKNSKFIRDLDYANNLKVYISLKTVNEYASEKHLASDIDLTLSRKFLSLNLNNIRCFDKLSLDFNSRRSLFILGDNGIGKTSLLDLISFLGQNSKKDSLYESEDKYVYNDHLDAQVTMDYIDELDMLGISHLNISVSAEVRNKFPSSDDALRICYVKTERTNKKFLEDFNIMLVDNKNFNEISKICRYVLDLNAEQGLIRYKGNVYIKNYDNSRVKLTSASSGITSIFKIIYSINEKFPDYIRSKSNQGFYYGCVLIDELELHLHPKWKKGIAKKLMEIYPDIFFIVTTHDPLILSGLNSSDIILIRKNENEVKSSVVENLPDLQGYGTDLLLSSPYFGLKNNLPINQDNLISMSYREKLAFQIVEESLELNLNYSSEELSLLVAQRFSERVE